ncbi:uncharacterized protein ACIB01_019466 [Guaruba guarouba]
MSAAPGLLLLLLGHVGSRACLGGGGGGCVSASNQGPTPHPSIQSDCSSCLPGPGPIAALVAVDVIMTLLIAGGAYCLGGGAEEVRSSPAPRGGADLSGAAGRPRGRLQRAQAIAPPLPIPHQRLSAPSPK